MHRLLIASIVLVLATSWSQAQSTAFTYQGQLNSNGTPTSGLHDFRFRLFDAASGGAQVGSTLCFDGVNVSNGTFSVQLDFGQQFITTSQRHIDIQVRREIGQPCTDNFGYVLLSPRQPLTSTPASLHANSAFALDAADGSPANAVVVNNDGIVGIGTSTPGASALGTKLDVAGGSLLVSNAGDQADLLWLASERSWVFRQEGAGAGAALKLESVGGGGNKNFVIQTTGLVGIGTTTPLAKLDVRGDISATSINSPSITTSRFQCGIITSGPSVFRGGASFSGVLVGNHTSTFSGSGVLGTNVNSDASSWGVFSQGRFGASGTKSFRIDHPDDPTNRYLLHYCTESPEAINFYRGVVVLDSRGMTAVQLPSYFGKININPSYQLTPVGAPMPTLHVSTEINEQALAAGARIGPEVLAPRCWFEIAGGIPGGKVSWRVEAVRNDEFVRRFGAPVEVEKPTPDQGVSHGERP